MNNRNIIIAGAIVVGLYLFSQTKKIAQKVSPKRIGQPTTWLEHIAALRKAAQRKAALRKATAQKIGKKIGKTVAQKVAPKRIGQPTTWLEHIAALRKQTAQKIGKIIGKKVAQKVAQKKVASWKAPYRFQNPKFRVITPSDLLKNLAKKDIARKKAIEQKKVQKTTHSTQSDRRKSRLEALYGSHWHDIWLKRQKRG